MYDKTNQTALVIAYNQEIFVPLFNDQSYFFHLAVQMFASADSRYQPRPVELCQCFGKDGAGFLRTCQPSELKEQLALPEHRYPKNGCVVTIQDFYKCALSDELIKENYAMLTKEQRNAVLLDDRYGAFEEMLAVAVLRRRLDLLDNKSQIYDSELFTVETEQIGRGLRIKWRFKPQVKGCGYDIVGFRRTGGFLADRWDEANNGTLVIHGDKDGEVVELLREGEAQFYTFFLKPWHEDEKHPRRSPLRFQVTIATKEETDALRNALDRIERQSLNLSTHNVSAALRELGLYAEFDTAIEQRKKLMERQIETAGYDPEEKEEKLSRLRDVVATVRDKYQQ